MSAAASQSPAPPQSEGEPGTMAELYRRAKADLAKPTAEAHLRWIFWRARCVGRLEAARLAVKRIHEQEAMSMSLQMTTLSEPVKAAFAAYAPDGPTRGAVEVHLVEMAAMADAAREIEQLIAARAPAPMQGGRR
jgi:hypothetical protein